MLKVVGARDKQPLRRKLDKFVRVTLPSSSLKHTYISIQKYHERHVMNLQFVDLIMYIYAFLNYVKY